jgi:hypothetical protein
VNTAATCAALLLESSWRHRGSGTPARGRTADRCGQRCPPRAAALLLGRSRNMDTFASKCRFISEAADAIRRLRRSAGLDHRPAARNDDGDSNMLVPDTLQGALLLSVIDFFLSFVVIAAIGCVLAAFPWLGRMWKVEEKDLIED